MKKIGFPLLIIGGPVCQGKGTGAKSGRPPLYRTTVTGYTRCTARFFGGFLMEEKRFQRRIEDFTCGRCGKEVHGTGYTNHCPHCLWSRHVDRNPGDRRENCGGMMRPVALEQRRGGYMVVHRCEVCGITRKNRTAPEDSLEAMIEVMRECSEDGGGEGGGGKHRGG